MPCPTVPLVVYLAFVLLSSLGTIRHQHSVLFGLNWHFFSGFWSKNGGFVRLSLLFPFCSRAIISTHMHFIHCFHICIATSHSFIHFPSLFCLKLTNSRHLVSPRCRNGSLINNWSTDTFAYVTPYATSAHGDRTLLITTFSSHPSHRST